MWDSSSRGKYIPADIQFTADDEEPSCDKCDCCWDDYHWCNKCGPEYGWAGYIRTVWEEIKEDD